MKLGIAVTAAVVVAALAAALPGATGAKERPALGWAYATKQLAWFDPATLRPLAGARVALREGVCTSSFSPDGTRVALSSCSGQITFVDVRKMRRAGDMFVTSQLGAASAVAWLRPDRLLATGVRDDDAALAVIDPARRRVVRLVRLAGPAAGQTVLPGRRLVFLVGNYGSFGPARVAVANAEGAVRTVVLDRISTGTVVREDGDARSAESRGVGFAVDPAGGGAFVVAPDLTVAEVDLGTLDVSYHGPVRSLSKFVDGPARQAAWLGNGILAVAGADYATTGTGSARRTNVTPYGLRLVDTRTWTSRTLDPHATGFLPGAGVVLVETPAPGHVRTVTAWGGDGQVRYTLKVPPQAYLNLQAGRGYVCQSVRLVRVVAGATGTTLAAPRGRSCVRLLGGSGTP